MGRDEPAERDPAAARATEAARRAAPRAASDPARPAFHFRPPAGWMNDPNGAIHHAGRFHLFYQHNPYSDTWGRIHWGHARSPDLVRWEHLPVALAPRTDQGEAHCFSGSAWPAPEGGPTLYYTSYPADTGRRAAEQWAVRCDSRLRRFGRAEQNPVLRLSAPDVPDFQPDWRDPYVFGADGRTFLLLGAVEREAEGPAAGPVGPAAEPGGPVIPLFEAADRRLLSWRYRGPVLRAGEGEVDFFECPALVRIGEGRWLLWYSAHGPVRALGGRFDPGGPSFAAESSHVLDRSTHFYAPTRFARAPGGRCLVVGWVRGWDGGRGWNGALSLPRELVWGEEGELLQSPVPELRELRGEGWRLPERERGEALGSGPREPTGGESGPAAGERRQRVPHLRSPTLEVAAELEAPEGAACGLRLRDGDREVAVVRWHPGRGTVSVGGRRFAGSLDLSGAPRPAGHAASWRAEQLPAPAEAGSRGRRLRLHLFWDRSVLELFVAGGREVYTAVLDGRGEPVEVEAFGAAPARLQDLRAWPVRGIW